MLAAGALPEPFPVDLSFVGPDDLLLHTTRPPKDDAAQGSRKQVELAHTDLEQRLFDAWDRYLDTCSRLHVTLNRRLAGAFEPGFESRRSMSFRERTGAPYKDLNALYGGAKREPCGRGENRTAAFLLRLGHAWKGGPGLLGVFGMDGVSTLVWAYRLARDFQHLLHEPGFVMAELTAGEIPRRATNMLWAKDWQVEVMLRSEP